MRKPTVATEQLEGEKRLQAANETRWNSQLKMIHSVLEVPNSKLSNTSHMLTTYEHTLLHELVDIFTPFEEATDFVQKDKYHSAGYALHCIKGLHTHLTQLLNPPKSSISSVYHYTAFIKKLQESVDICMRTLEKNTFYRLAALCDPRFKTRWCTSDKEKIDKTLI